MRCIKTGNALLRAATMYLRLPILFGLLLWASSCYGAIYDNVADLPGTKFDFVVVGGMSYLVTHREPVLTAATFPKVAQEAQL